MCVFSSTNYYGCCLSIGTFTRSGPLKSGCAKIRFVFVRVRLLVRRLVRVHVRMLVRAHACACAGDVRSTPLTHGWCTCMCVCMQNRSPLTNVTISDELTLLTDEDQTGTPGDNNTSPSTTATATPPSAAAAADRVGSHLTPSIHLRSSASVGQLKDAFEFEVWCACGGRAEDGVGRSTSKHARCMPSLMLCEHVRARMRACWRMHVALESTSACKLKTPCDTPYHPSLPVSLSPSRLPSHACTDFRSESSGRGGAGEYGL